MWQLSDHLPALNADFPSYYVSIARTHYGLSVVAERIGQGDGPLVVITADIDELRTCLNERTMTP